MGISTGQLTVGTQSVLVGTLNPATTARFACAGTATIYIGAGGTAVGTANGYPTTSGAAPVTLNNSSTSAAVPVWAIASAAAQTCGYVFETNE